MVEYFYYTWTEFDNGTIMQELIKASSVEDGVMQVKNKYFNDGPITIISMDNWTYKVTNLNWKGGTDDSI